MAKRVFVSFDFDNDATLKELLVGKSRLNLSPFVLADWSLKEAAPDADWEKKAEAKIKACEIVLVLVGKETSKASGVKKEVAMARANDIKVVQVTNLEKATRVENVGTLYKWTWENLKTLLA